MPVGAALVVDGAVVAAGRNRRAEGRPVTGHAELDALERAGPLDRSAYARATLFTTLSPCGMCAGAIVRLGIQCVVIGDHESVGGAPDVLAAHGIEVVHARSPACRELIARYLAAGGQLWP
jgi:cytosine deaminase